MKLKKIAIGILLCCQPAISFSSDILSQHHDYLDTLLLEHNVLENKINQNLIKEQPGNNIKNFTFKIEKATKLHAHFQSENLPVNTVVYITGKDGKYTYLPDKTEQHIATVFGDRMDIEVHLPKDMTFSNEAKLQLVKIDYTSRSKRSIVGDKDERRRLACYKNDNKQMYYRGLSSVSLGGGSGSSLGNSNLFLTNYHVLDNDISVKDTKIQRYKDTI